MRKDFENIEHYLKADKELTISKKMISSLLKDIVKSCESKKNKIELIKECFLLSESLIIHLDLTNYENDRTFSDIVEFITDCLEDIGDKNAK